MNMCLMFCVYTACIVVHSIVKSQMLSIASNYCPHSNSLPNTLICNQQTSWRAKQGRIIFANVLTSSCKTCCICCQPKQGHPSSKLECISSRQQAQTNEQVCLQHEQVRDSGLGGCKAGVNQQTTFECRLRPTTLKMV